MRPVVWRLLEGHYATSSLLHLSIDHQIPVIIISDSDEEPEAMGSQHYEIQETLPFSPHVMNIWIRAQIPFLLFTKMLKNKVKFPMILCHILFIVSSASGPPRFPVSKFTFRLSTLASNIFLCLCNRSIVKVGTD